ncbi:hypothetical protein [Streptomyces sp. NPDC096311]|uniref:hypothetical protein n=1 Tax=Streptomyces sp. NPDC096311 TaxID=3366083 RepID=UPI00380C7920
MTLTVVVMEPCCEKSEPDYDPGPCPVWHRFPSSWPPRCLHAKKRVLTITEHQTRESADREYVKTLGWDSLPGYLYEDVMPPEGQRFRIMGVGGNSINGHFHTLASAMVFPTAQFAMEYAEKKRFVLYNIVGDQDQRVRLSSYSVPIGTELFEGEPA